MDLKRTCQQLGRVGGQLALTPPTLPPSAISAAARIAGPSLGSTDDAREIYNLFTEGYETADLKEAKALFDKLNL